MGIRNPQKNTKLSDDILLKKPGNAEQSIVDLPCINNG